MTFKLDDATSKQAMSVAIDHLYGSSILDDDDFLAEASIFDFAEVAVATNSYQVTGLHKLVFKAANFALNDCIENESKLREFLFSSHSIFDNSTPDMNLAFIVRILSENLTKLHKEALFQQLLM